MLSVKMLKKGDENNKTLSSLEFESLKSLLIMLFLHAFYCFYFFVLDLCVKFLS